MSSGVSVVLLAVQLALNLSDQALTGDERYDVVQVSGDTSMYTVEPNLVDEFLDSLIDTVNGKLGTKLGERKQTIITSLKACEIAAQMDTNQSMSVVNTANTGGDGNYYTWMYYSRKSGKQVSCQTLTAGYHVTMGNPYVIVHNHKDNLIGESDYDEKLDLPAVVTVRAATLQLSFALGTIVTNKAMVDTPIVSSLIAGAKALPKDAISSVDSIESSRSTKTRAFGGSSVIQLRGSYKPALTNTEWEFVY